MPQNRTLPSYLGPKIPPVSAFSLADILDHLQQECGDASNAMLNVVETFQGDLGLELRRKLDAESKIQLVNSQQARRAHTLSKRTSVARSKLDRYSAKHSSIDDEIDRMIDTAASASSLARLVASKVGRVQQLITSDLSIPSKYTTLNKVFPSLEEMISPEINRPGVTVEHDEDLPLPQILSVDDQINLKVEEEMAILGRPNNGDDSVHRPRFEIETTLGGILASNSQPTIPLSSETHQHAIAEPLASSYTAGYPPSNHEQRTSRSLSASPIFDGAAANLNTIPYDGKTAKRASASADSTCPPDHHTYTDKLRASNIPTKNSDAMIMAPTHDGAVNDLPPGTEAASTLNSSESIEDSMTSEAFEDPMTPEAFEDFMASSISKFRNLQKKRYKEAPFFDEPAPTIPHQNPLNLLYSSLLAKQSLATFLHQRSRPLFSILRTKSDPTIMQSLQTSHFKKLRISGTHIGAENWPTPCQEPDSKDHGLAPDTICEDENENASLPTAASRSLVPEILSSEQVDDYDDSSDEEINKPSPRSPSRTHQPSHRTLRPKRSILKLRGTPKQRFSRVAPESPLEISSPKSNNVYSPAQPLVVCAHGASATLVRPPALDFFESGPFHISDAASIESYRSIKSLQKLQEYI